MTTPINPRRRINGIPVAAPVYPRGTRCEMDHKDGGVCLRLLNPDGSCPGQADHAPTGD